MPLYKATIDVLVETDSEIEAADCIAEAMRPILRNFAPTSSVIDWKYATISHYPKEDNGDGFEYSA